MSGKVKHPMQPLVRDEKGVLRFKENALVSFLLDAGGIDMNMLAKLPNISNDDRSQFAQLIGYSVSRFGDLSYANPDIVAHADWVEAKEARYEEV